MSIELGTSAVKTGIQDAFELVRNPLEGVKASLMALAEENAAPDSEVLVQTVQHSLGSGGKYLRPVVTLLMAQTTGEQTDPQEHATIEVAAVTEMIHVATLLHDDVIDGSELRRGKKTVRAQWGNKISVLSGDYLLAQASVKLSRLGNTRLVSIFSHVLADLCDGEVEQLNTSFTLNTAWDSYYRKTICKTASLFSAGCEAAGVINELPEDRIQDLKTYGRCFGIAFQIVDDLLDYTATEAEMGKPVLDDLRNGLMNAPVLLALESEALSSEDKIALRQAIERLFEAPAEASSNEETIEETIQQIQTLLRQAQALEQTRELANRYIQDAKSALDFVEQSPAKQALMDIVDYVTERRN